MKRVTSRGGSVAAMFLLLAVVSSVAASAASATEASPQWTVSSVSLPTNFTPDDASGAMAYVVTLTNTGSAPSDGSPIVITDELPSGLTSDLQGASGEDTLAAANILQASAGFSCGAASCTYTGVVKPSQTLVVRFPVDVTMGAAATVTNVVRVTGGGGLQAAMQTPTRISSEPAKFGLAPGGSNTALSSTQAGAHPDLTTTIAFNTIDTQGALAGDEKNTTDRLPVGFAGDLIDTPSCSSATFLEERCSRDTQIGIVTLTLVGVDAGVHLAPVYNVTPDPGELAKLAFVVEGNARVEGGVFLDPDYGLRVVFENINQSFTELDAVTLTTWGVPAAQVHNALRFQPEAREHDVFGAAPEGVASPFLTNPTSCGQAPLEATFTTNSWEEQGNQVAGGMRFGPIVGCDRLTMEPSLTAEATTTKASAPTGLALNMSIPQTYDNAEGLATSTLKKAVVTLPEGMTVNPSAGAGLAACSEAQYAAEAEQAVAGQGCPTESKLGTVRILTPSLKEEVTGSVFIAQPYANPFHSLLALYVVARIPLRGVLVKVAGEVSADPLTGRLVTTFDNLPPLPFNAFTFTFRQGATSPLVTPAACGDYTVEAQLTPSSNSEGPPLTPLIPPFSVSSGFDGGACPTGGVPPFTPQVSAGTLDNRAASYSPLDIRVTRNDGDQEITGFSAQLPPGLTANLSGVPFCLEAAIALARSRSGAQEEAEPSCPAASQIGHTLVGAGVGSTLAYTPGTIYMAGPYQGAPFSVAAITPAKVGPFDLGTVVVHLPLQIDPLTATVSVAAGGADQIPHILKGIVIHVRDIRVYVDRQSFVLNPTSCARDAFGVTVIGSGASFTNPGDDVPVGAANMFQAADCGALRFAPKFAVSTSGRTSRAKGASLKVKLTYPRAPQGTQSNIRSVKVELPRQLPSRLTTLQKACTAAVFNANPASCPTASIVGHARALTPILPVPLEGPAYFVSHGGEAFPSLVVVLQGYGVTISLVGTTHISHSGITSSTFKTVPDQPIGSFELTLPEGKFSALAANTNLCSVKGGLHMPTTFTAQDGATIKQSTSIAVSGCPKAVRRERKKPHRKKRK